MITITVFIMKIIIAGDFSLQGRVAKNQNIDVWDKLHGGFCKLADYNIVNFESPVTNNTKAILKDGPSLKNSLASFDLLKKMGFDIFTLANNHLNDYGATGVLDTINGCKEYGIKYVGAGSNIEEAVKPLELTKDNQTVAILNACENESSIATKNEPGAAPLDIIRLYRQIKELKGVVDKVICIFHGGVEHYQLPTPDMKKRYHFLADAGADLIVNHHQHCYSGYEIYNGVPIFYGLGNFYFDNQKKRNSPWNYGYLLKMDIDKELTFEIVPYEQCNKDPKLVFLEKSAFDEKLAELNAIIADDTKLEQAFNSYIINYKKPLSPFLPYGNHYLKALYHRGLFPSFLGKMRKVFIQNAVRCESHREVLLRFLETELGN